MNDWPNTEGYRKGVASIERAFLAVFGPEYRAIRGPVCEPCDGCGYLFDCDGWATSVCTVCDGTGRP